MAVAAAMNAKLDYNKLEAGEGRMCTVFDEIEKEGEVKGRAFGIIEICLEFGLSESDILNRLQKKLEVSLEEAQDYFAKYKKREVLEAMEEARRIGKEPNTKRYDSFAEVLEDFHNSVNQRRLHKSIERLEKKFDRVY